MDFTLSCVCFDIVHHAPYVLSITLFEFCMLRVASSFLAFFFGQTDGVRAFFTIPVIVL
jgi:hypothetical protein